MFPLTQLYTYVAQLCSKFQNNIANCYWNINELVKIKMEDRVYING